MKRTCAILGGNVMNRKKDLCRVVIAVWVFLGAFAGVGMAQWSLRGPLSRSAHTAVLDPTSGRMIVFGGFTTSVDAPPLTHFNDVWYLNGATNVSVTSSWTQAKPKGSPPSARAGHSAIYNPASNRMVVFGGSSGYAAPCNNELWILENANGVGAAPKWVPVTPAGTPPSARGGHRAVYNPANNTMIVFGGNDCFSTYYNDTWILQNADGTTGTPTWSFLTVGVPFGRIGHVQAYDPTTNRMIIFGGANQTTFFNDAWVLINADGTGGLAQWVGLLPTGAPCAREVPSGFYDPVTNELVVFGGYCSAPMNDKWVLTDANGNSGSNWCTDCGTWIPVSAGTAPLGRFGHTAVFDSGKNRMTIFGGEVQANGLSTDTVSVLSLATAD